MSLTLTANLRLTHTCLAPGEPQAYAPDCRHVRLMRCTSLVYGFQARRTYLICVQMLWF